MASNRGVEATTMMGRVAPPVGRLVAAERLRALPYVGGKSATAKGGVGPWVTSLLPTARAGVVTYCEPFAGMLGVLLQRAPVDCEAANDISGLAVNWWRVVAVPELMNLLADRLERTPNRSEWHFDEALRRTGEWEAGPAHADPDLECAYWWTIQAYMAGFGGKCTFAINLNSGSKYLISRERLVALQRRIQGVQLLNKDANYVIGLFGREPRSLIYCDPPYPTSPHYYGSNLVDFEAMAAAIDEAKGWVAISGQEGDAWEERCNRRLWISTLDTVRTAGWMGSKPEKRQAAKTAREMLWTSYDPAEVRPQAALFDLPPPVGTLFDD